jgi:hypothetical protein
MLYDYDEDDDFGDDDDDDDATMTKDGYERRINTTDDQTASATKEAWS